MNDSAATTGTSGGSDRPLRADAQRNRLSVLAAARRAFRTARDTVPLEDIARDAGVGIATLYRNFPTREALVEAVYATELEDVTSNARPLLNQFPADVALRAWMNRYAEFIRTKRAMLDTLRTGWTSGGRTLPSARERVTTEISAILSAGMHDGVFRADITPDDVTSLLLGAFLSTNTEQSPDQIERLFGLIIDAARPRSQRSADAFPSPTETTSP